jgi:hypothetical protein
MLKITDLGHRINWASFQRHCVSTFRVLVKNGRPSFTFVQEFMHSELFFSVYSPKVTSNSGQYVKERTVYVHRLGRLPVMNYLVMRINVVELMK